MKPATFSRGFTLAELAVVLVIVGLLLGGLMIPLSAQNDIRYVNDTKKTLNDINDALLGYAAANGRLPCPASATSNGFESPLGGGNCNIPTANNANTGFVPAVTLGIGPTDSNGFAIDAWGNPIHYAVTTANTNAFTTAAGIKGLVNGAGTLFGMAVAAPDLQVCSGAACTTPLTNGAPNGAAAVIFSTGKGGATAGRSPDEIQNLLVTVPNRYVSHEMSTATGNEFDDIVIWISPNTLYNRMITAGQLP